ncbi:MAG: hypothetical protein LRS43_01565, partial [Desulfurococcales archaeon]|nr:hypothetical protein [Desulfurococcales archaeon]
EPSIEWLEAFSEKSPRALPNHIVAPLASEIMGIPASSASDSLDLLAKYGGLKPRVYDYSVRWRILKRVSRSL